MSSKPKGQLIPERLREQRKALGWNQTRLAQTLGNSQETLVSLWETGSRVPNHKTVRRLARAMGVAIAYLIGYTNSPVLDVDPTGDEFNAFLGRRLCALREAFGLSHKDVSKAVGASVSTLKTWEKGGFGFSIRRLIPVTQFYGCSMDYLLGRTDDPLGSAAEDSVPIDALAVAQNPYFLQTVIDPVTRQVLTRADLYPVLRALAQDTYMDPGDLKTAEQILQTVGENDGI